jgi:catechol 2,3-dioxygenase-like lactoylglutathione lyase family enzyme
LTLSISNLKERTMLAGFNHVAILTDDLERLGGFYRDVFEVSDIQPMEFDGVHHWLIRVGGASVLHAFAKSAPTPGPVFERGRIDHLALNVDDRSEFDRLRERLVAAGASSGAVTDFGVLLSVSFTDPDGLDCELCWMRPDRGLADAVDPW